MATWNWTLIGIVLFVVGVLIFTVGGMISAVQDPKAFNEQFLSKAFSWGQWGPPETRGSKWPMRIGLALGAGGMLTLWITSKSH